MRRIAVTGLLLLGALGALGALAACEGDTIYLPPRDAGSGGGADDGGGGGGGGGSDAGGAGGGGDARPGVDLPPGADIPRVDTGRPSDTPAAPPDTGGGGGVCLPNDDGVVTRAEVVPVYGAVARYLANREGTTVAVDPDGTPDPDLPGAYIWDFRDGPRDLAVGLRVEAWSPDAWYAAHFPADVSYVTSLGPQTPDVLGVFRFRGDALEMLGLASREDGPGRTLLVYDDPVALYRFPLEVGRSWETASSFRDARIQGAPQAGTETYRFTVDRGGSVVLTDFTFTSVVRIRMDLTQTFVVSQEYNTLHSVHYFWFTECVGEVARVVGPLTPDDPPPAVTSAREFRRLGL